MKRSKAVKKGRKAKPQKPKKKTIILRADKPKRRYITLPERMEWYRPIKKPVTLRLDADVLAWFKKSGRGYQTRINRALRNLMKNEIKEEKKPAGE